MALENTAQRVKRESLEALPRIVTATQDASIGYTFCTEEIVTWLEKNQLAEGNREIKNEAGAIATRATTKGIEKIMSETVNETPVAAPAKFVIEDAIPLPASTRGGKRESAYPFGDLQPGQSFFIPASEKHPEPAKSLASTVSGATKRYDELIPGETKEVMNPKTKEKKTVPATKHTHVFILRPVADGAPWGRPGIKGAGVWRKE